MQTAQELVQQKDDHFFSTSFTRHEAEIKSIQNDFQEQMNLKQKHQGDLKRMTAAPVVPSNAPITTRAQRVQIFEQKFQEKSSQDPSLRVKHSAILQKLRQELGEQRFNQLTAAIGAAPGGMAPTSIPSGYPPNSGNSGISKSGISGGISNSGISGGISNSGISVGIPGGISVGMNAGISGGLNAGISVGFSPSKGSVPSGYPPQGFPPSSPTPEPVPRTPSRSLPTPTGFPTPNPSGFPPTSQTPSGYPPAGYPPSASTPTPTPSGFPPSSQTPSGYPPSGYPPSSYPPQSPQPLGKSSFEYEDPALKTVTKVESVVVG